MVKLMRINTTDDVYMDVVSTICFHGFEKGDRTGVGTTSYFGTQGRFSLKHGEIPVITRREVILRSVIHELLWFISGSTDIEYLKQNKVSIWDSWVIPGTERFDEGGKLIGGSIGKGAYGSQWRNREDTVIVPKTTNDAEYLGKGFTYLGDVDSGKVFTRRIDQLQNVINTLKTNPDSRRILITAFNPDKEDFCALPPCHSYVQFWSRELEFEERLKEMLYRAKTDVSIVYSEGFSEEDTIALMDKHNIPTRTLSCQLYMRSNDVLLGGVFNIAQYGILTHMIADIVNMATDEFIWTVGDAHIYDNQKEGLNELFKREPVNCVPKIKFKRKVDRIDDFVFDDIEIIDYHHREKISFPVAV